MATTKKLNKEGLNQVWSIIMNNFEPKETGKHLSTNDFTDELKEKLLSMDDKIKEATTAAYKVKGSVDFADIPKAVEGEENPNVVGDIYNIKNAFVADESFIESERGGSYPAGTNIVYTEDGWDAMGGIYDFSDFMMKSDLEDLTEEEIATICKMPENVTPPEAGGEENGDNTGTEGGKPSTPEGTE